MIKMSIMKMKMDFGKVASDFIINQSICLYAYSMRGTVMAADKVYWYLMEWITNVILTEVRSEMARKMQVVAMVFQ